MKQHSSTHVSNHMKFLLLRTWARDIQQELQTTTELYLEYDAFVP